jgi:hypothetical protein
MMKTRSDSTQQVLVAVAKEPAGRIKTSTVQLLDYNLNRSVLLPIYTLIFPFELD